MSVLLLIMSILISAVTAEYNTGAEQRLRRFGINQIKHLGTRQSVGQWTSSEDRKTLLSRLFEAGPVRKEHNPDQKSVDREPKGAPTIKQHVRSSLEKHLVQQGFGDPCEGGRVINCKTGSLMSPGYPQHYYPSSNCSWHLKADPGKVIEIDFVDVSLPSGGDCVNSDRVVITDIGAALSTTPVTHCGEGVLPKLTTVGNEAFIQFVTDEENEDKGILFNFLVRDPVPCEDVIELNGESGSLVSTGYPERYQPNSNCRWRIVTDPDKRISVTFTDVAIEQARSCEWDKVSLYDGWSVESPRLGRFCGHDQPSNIKSSGNVMLVVLASDGSGEDRGFSLEWTTEN